MQKPGIHLDRKVERRDTFSTGKKVSYPSVVYHNVTGPFFWETKRGIPTILGKGASRDNKKRCCFHGIV